jgi:UDP-N-acetylmuramoyl-L-alanyl-D-glutamate--2,6-diaminopimelate ligase
MEAMMSTAKAYDPKRILCVFGLDSGRAHLRRADCGKILGLYADHIILSDTSPKKEDPLKIMADIAAGIEMGGGAGKYEMIRDRNDSIPKILDMAEEGDIVLLVGQGNRTYQDIGGEIIHLDEREIVKEYFK